MKKEALKWWDGLSKVDQETIRNEYTGKKNHLFNTDVDVIVKIYKKLHNKLEKPWGKMFWELDLNPIIMKRHSIKDDAEWRKKHKMEIKDCYDFDFEENENEEE